MVIACRNVCCRTQVRALPCLVSHRLTPSMMRELPLIISYITSPPLTECHQELTSTAIYWLSTTKYQPFLSYTDPVHSFTTSKRTVEQIGSRTMFLYLCIWLFLHIIAIVFASWDDEDDDGDNGSPLCPAGGSVNVWTLNTPCWLSQM